MGNEPVVVLFAQGMNCNFHSTGGVAAGIVGLDAVYDPALEIQPRGETPRSFLSELPRAELDHHHVAIGHAAVVEGCIHNIALVLAKNTVKTGLGCSVGFLPVDVESLGEPVGSAQDYIEVVDTDVVDDVLFQLALARPVQLVVGLLHFQIESN